MGTAPAGSPGSQYPKRVLSPSSSQTSLSSVKSSSSRSFVVATPYDYSPHGHLFPRSILHGHHCIEALVAIVDKTHGPLALQQPNPVSPPIPKRTSYNSIKVPIRGRSEQKPGFMSFNCNHRKLSSHAYGDNTKHNLR
ncbi:hypothetical protein ASPFODRAFT_58800 [Aspergillus luchuensis CBS 106.47]|uniref:Uncharacterized protein n=1 Tax=Aspergillus luchuensis (strain CBS 106.47) TaxID=1137211 RepID=A0A1M3TME5_ASPLC|nr:hypothetical protein ASPFODRAFT_58800 [Aspergillus luchuensis CBS 106.47]